MQIQLISWENYKMAPVEQLNSTFWFLVLLKNTNHLIWKQNRLGKAMVEIYCKKNQLR